MGTDEITWVTDQVAITNYVSAHDRAGLRGHGIRAVLCLDRELLGDQPGGHDVACVRLAHLIDGPNPPLVFQRAVQELTELVESHGRVVVHCRAGRSRSVAVVAAYLKASRAMSADEALRTVTAKRPSAVTPALAKLVASHT